MQYIGDFHIHSSYSRATSKQLTPENLDLWGRIKGISVIGTGDFTHPGWTADLKQKLEPAEDGLYTLRNEYRIKGENDGLYSEALAAVEKTRFVLTAEISSIYKFGDKVRKVHNVVFAPDFTVAERIQEKIERLGGNIRSDGRPILGLDSRDLLELCLEADENILFVPAHIWTPWFSALGSKSGFDTIKDCYRDLSGHIFAVETGLSSDPPMNWMCSFLDEYTLISNSDAHSPEKLGREANLFDTGLSYPEITGAIKGGTAEGFRGTVEFFPQEGKYHFDGHRKCNIAWDPLETMRHGGICPVCGRPVTVGVLNRVAQLADRKDIGERPGRDPFHSLIPLKEIIAELEGVGAGSKKVRARYTDCLNLLGPELGILLYKDIEEIESLAGAPLANAVERMRRRQVHATPGYDGEYGHIRVWDEDDILPQEDPGFSLFRDAEDISAGADQCPVPEAMALIEFDLAVYQEQREKGAAATVESPVCKKASYDGLNPEQQEAVDYAEGHSLIIAGPGTGKTRTVVEKIIRLVQNGTEPSGILAVTFANKAAGELRDRLNTAGPGGDCVGVFTFHGLGLSLLKPHLRLLGRSENFLIIDDEEKALLLKTAGNMSAGERKELISFVSGIKNGLVPFPQEPDADFDRFKEYQDFLKKHDCFDYDDLVYLPARLFEKCPDILADVQRDISHIIVDEYQDINRAQYELMLALSKNAVVCAVGDPNQSIYSFRGGSPEFIQRFTLDFPDAGVFSLSQSYRCPDTVLRASSQILGEGEGLLKGQRPGVKISIVKTASAASEAEQIARDIEARSGGMGFFSIDSGVTGMENVNETALSDIAVLCRTSMQMPVIEKAFSDHRIPFRTIRTDSLFNRDPYRSFLNFIRILLRRGPDNTVFTGEVRNISPGRMEALELPLSLGEAVELFTGLYSRESDPVDAGEMGKELACYWSDGEGANEFAGNARLGSGLDRYDPRMQAVTIMTIHAAKGLEFDTVYIPGCEDSILPCTLTGEDSSNEDEEKRLLYVAMTRAIRDLVLSCAGTRVIFGKTVEQRESPFLAAIEKALVERQQPEFKPRDKTPDQQLSLFS